MERMMVMEKITSWAVSIDDALIGIDDALIGKIASWTRSTARQKSEG
jgi:hypothetical protein